MVVAQSLVVEQDANHAQNVGICSLAFQITMKVFLSNAISCLVLATLEAGSAAVSPNYVVTGFFTSSDSGDVYSVTDFNDQAMVCGTWKRTSKETGREEAGGIFVWQNGVMRKLTPQQAGITYVDTPTAAQGSRVQGSARMTNVPAKLDRTSQ